MISSEAIEQIVSNNLPEQRETLNRLMSVEGSLECVLEKGKSMGFHVAWDGSSGGYIEFCEKCKYEGEIDDGDELRGDGIDDVGIFEENPVFVILPFRESDYKSGIEVTILYAMAALKKAGYAPNGRIRLLLGEAEFEEGHIQVGNDGRGSLTFQLVRKMEKFMGGHLTLKSLNGNRAVVFSKDPKDYEGIKDVVATMNVKMNMKSEAKDSRAICHKGTCKRVGKSLEILAETEMLFRILRSIPFSRDEVKDVINFYNDHVDSDPDLEVVMVEGNEKAISLTLNARYPETKTAEDVYDGIRQICDDLDIGIVKGHDRPPLFSADGEEYLDGSILMTRAWAEAIYLECGGKSDEKVGG